jgi:iron complex outermembrane receptor protein
MKEAIGILSLLCAAGALAQPTAVDAHGGLLEEIVVRAHPLRAEQLAQSYRVLQGDELARSLDANLGAVVGQLPGVSTSFFGQAVGRPVIHGLGGARVRVMEDHIASLDASVLSEDHAVTIEPFLADSIEILKGPASLTYGSGAIGGIVDVHTGRVPEVLPDEPFSGQVEGRFDDVADQRTGVARLDGAVGPVAWHADAFSRRLKDYDIPGYAESSALRRLEDDPAHDEHEEGEDEHHEGESVRDTLPNSDLETNGGAFGISLIGEAGFIGVAVSGYESEYGLPGGTHAHHDEEESELDHDAGYDFMEAGDEVRLDLDQTRWDLSAGLKDPFPNFSELAVRIGRNDYTHSELEGRGEVGSRYDVEAWEGRIEALHDALAGWNGVIGLQFGQEDFNAVGEEVFAPPHDTESMAVFIVEERQLDRLTVQAGARAETVAIDAQGFDSDRFNTFSLSGGLIVPLPGGWELGLVADLAQRAPAAAELYSDGPHLATQSYEIGDPSLEKEQAGNLAATLRFNAERVEASATLYATRFSDFIYQADTGEVADDLPVRVWSQSDADFRGLDLEARFRMVIDAPIVLDGRLFYDFVDAELDVRGEDRLPRLPPDRVGAGLEARWEWLTANLDYLHAMKQDDTAAFELETERYDDLRAQVSGRFDLGDAELTLFVQGRNLTDDEQRNHVSFIKDYAPLPGRSVLAGMRLAF